MPREIEYTPQADVDIDEIADYFASRTTSVAARFYQAVYDTAQFLARVSETSVIGTLYESDDLACQDIRLWQVKGFSKYLIFYRVENSTLKILRVLHGARDCQNLVEGENVTQKEK